MPEVSPRLAAALAAIALLPAAVIWWRGKVLARVADDPTLPERLFAEGRRNALVLVLALAVLVVAAPRSAVWTCPLAIGGSIAASYPLRKVLYGETWPLRAYLSFMGRLFVGVWGFWIALAWTPFVVADAGSVDWLAASGIGGGLLLWNARAGDVLRRLLRARPLADPVLLDRFTAVVRRSTVQMPRLEWVPLGGGAIPNAVALPSLRGSAVLFSETLLAHLDAAEAAAICAHEIAHLEHYTRRRLRHLHIVNVLLIVAAVVFGLLPRRLGWVDSLLPSALWLVTVVGVVAWRVRHRQQRETESDLRAIALCGDADALVRALTKLYTFARLPRRFDVETERHATHPSLARRIRDIRAAAGAAPAALDASVSFAASDGRGGTVTFDVDRMHWSEGDLATHSLSYAYLAELRLHVGRGGAASLVAVERGGRKWQIAVAAFDVARLQSVLDVVDGRLGNPSAPAGVFNTLGRLGALFAALIALTLGQMAMMVTALLALLQGSYVLYAAAAVAAFATAAVAVLAHASERWETVAGLAATLVALGAWLAATAFARRGDPARRSTNVATAALGVCALIWAAGLLLRGSHPVDLHLSARAVPGAGVFLLSTGAALACLHLRWLRYAAAVVALAGATALIAGSTWFLDRFGGDPLLGRSEPIVWTTVDGTLQAEVALPFYASSVELSPAARALIAVKSADEEGEEEWYVGRPPAPLTRIEADQVLFVDDDLLIAVSENSRGAELRTMRVDSPEHAEWRHDLGGVSDPTLSYMPATGVWKVLGFDDLAGVIQVEGTLGVDGTRTTRWAPLGGGRRPQLAAAEGEHAIAVETIYEPSFLARGRLWQLALLLPGQIGARFSRLSGDTQTELAVTRLATECMMTPRSGDRLTCAAFDGARTRFATADAATGTITAMSISVPGRFTWTTMSPEGWLSGWACGGAAAIRPSTGEGIRMASGADHVTHLTAMNHAVASVLFRDGVSTVRIYSLESTAPRRAAR